MRDLKDFNPDNLIDGEHLPCVGGPLDGTTRPVELLYGVLPNAMFRYGENHWYRRDRRQYVYDFPLHPNAAVPLPTFGAGTDSDGGAGGAGA